MPLAQAKWNRINLIVGKQPAMDALTLQLVPHRGKVFHEGWGHVHYSELHNQWESLKQGTKDDELMWEGRGWRNEDQHFCFTHSYECIVAGYEVFGSDGDLSLYRVELSPQDGIELIAYDPEAFEGAMMFGLDVR